MAHICTRSVELFNLDAVVADVFLLVAVVTEAVPLRRTLVTVSMFNLSQRLRWTRDLSVHYDLIIKDIPGRLVHDFVCKG